jgi:hypothetical protein
VHTSNHYRRKCLVKLLSPTLPNPLYFPLFSATLIFTQVAVKKKTVIYFLGTRMVGMRFKSNLALRKYVRGL